MRPRLSHLLVLLLAACATEPVAPTPEASFPSRSPEREALGPAVADLAAKAEALLRSQDELVWKHWTEGIPADLAKTYVGTEGWLTPESVARVARLRAQTSDDRERRALEHLHAYLAGEWMAQQLADVSDAIASLEQSLTFQVAGTDRPYRNLESILASEKSALRRKQIYAAATPAVEKVAALVQRRGARAAELLPTLNLEPTAWTTELREATPEQLGALADAVLTRTQEAWTGALTRLAQRELQLPLDRIGRQDLPRLVRLPATEGFKRAEVILAHPEHARPSPAGPRGAEDRDPRRGRRAEEEPRADWCWGWWCRPTCASRSSRWVGPATSGALCTSSATQCTTPSPRSAASSWRSSGTAPMPRPSPRCSSRSPPSRAGWSRLGSRPTPAARGSRA
jgi:hypothetical protein